MIDSDNYSKHNKDLPPSGYLEDITLLLTGELTEWERDFLTSIKRQLFWSLKQTALYLKIRDKYLS